MHATYPLIAQMATIPHCIAPLAEEPPEVGPMFWETRDGYVMAMAWCEGFMQAVALRPKEWLPLTESGSHGSLMTPILCHLLDDDGNSVLGSPQDRLSDALDAAAEAIPAAVAGIHRFGRAKGPDFQRQLR
jgi:uncharacterized protein